MRWCLQKLTLLWPKAAWPEKKGWAIENTPNWPRFTTYLDHFSAFGYRYGSEYYGNKMKPQSIFCAYSVQQSQCFTADEHHNLFRCMKPTNRQVKSNERMREKTKMGKGTHPNRFCNQSHNQQSEGVQPNK